MQMHVLSLRYDGLDAAILHGIGTAGSKQVIGGGQMFLGAHAHYYLTGEVPERIDDRGPGFIIRDLGRREGSLILDLAVGILGSAIWDIANKAYGIDQMILDSYAAFKAGRLFEEPPYERRQRTLQPQRLNENVFDQGLARQHHLRRLLQRTRAGIASMTAPLGITASVLDISINDRPLDTWHGRLASGDDIDEWLQLHRATHGVPWRLS